MNIEKLLQQQPSAASSGWTLQAVQEPSTAFKASLLTTRTAVPHLSPTLVSDHPTSPIGNATYDATTLNKSAIASRVIEQAVGDSPGTYQDPELAAALESLREMVTKIDDTPHTTELNRSSLLLKSKPVDRPSEAELNRLLQKAEGEYCSLWTCWWHTYD